MHDPSWKALDPTGSMLFAGRWHSLGTGVIYTAQHISLAALEVLIRGGGRLIPPRIVTQIAVPDDLAIEKTEWVDMPDSQRFGDLWAKQKRSLILRVPSVVADKMESNFILNAEHPDFARISEIDSRPFHFDERFIFLK